MVLCRHLCLLDGLVGMKSVAVSEAMNGIISDNRNPLVIKATLKLHHKVDDSSSI